LSDEKRGSETGKLTEELRGKVEQMEMEIYQRAQEIQQINTRLVAEIQERAKSRREH
jgi:hypothetical protein